MLLYNVATIYASIAAMAVASPVSHPVGSSDVDSFTLSSAKRSSFVAADSLIGRQVLPPSVADYAYVGNWFDGTSSPDSCGYEPGETKDPYRSDCDIANSQWDITGVIRGSEGRITQVYETCVIAFVPAWASAGAVTPREQLLRYFIEVMNACPTDSERYGVTNYAYHTVNDVGRFSVYHSEYESDENLPETFYGVTISETSDDSPLEVYVDTDDQ